MHLFLVGPPGIGKSTVAPLLARLLGASAIDLDAEIERRAAKSPARIIGEDGMPRFRALETEALERLVPTHALVVVATGGGAPLEEANRRRMAALGLRVGLTGSVATVARGIGQTIAARGHLDLPPREHAARVLRERRSAYSEVEATFVVDRTAPVDVARAVAAWLVASRGVRLDVAGSRPYPILVRAGLLEHVGTHLGDLGWSGRAVIVGDTLTARRLAPAVAASCRAAGIATSTITVTRGERAKSVTALEHVWRGLARAGIGRDGGVIAVGGGTVGDLAGFAAATYLRGIRYAQVPTTLLAMVDSSIGGKTGIDLAAGKNLAGAFWPPDAVLADPAVLAGLPRRQRASGLAEVVKSAFLADRHAVAQAERSVAAVLEGDLGPTVGAIALAASLKARVVGQDEREAGSRELLNFGHTLGHAYESASGYRVTHGEAVSIGLVFATALAEELDLVPRAFRERLERILLAAGLPVRARIPAGTKRYLAADKKVRAGKVRWILPRAIGRFSEVTDVGPASLAAAGRVVEGR
ncbi:MAG TPA: 3-dehydroquinate synthase [Candidatus Saccharimonadales bacterium]|nr:3-dehydroquinate synthase [Candidatus Saccharimonadales bacterium]